MNTVDSWSSLLPQGPDDPNVVLLKVDAHRTAEYLGHPGRHCASLPQLRQVQVTG